LQLNNVIFKKFNFSDQNVVDLCFSREPDEGHSGPSENTVLVPFQCLYFEHIMKLLILH